LNVILIYQYTQKNKDIVTRRVISSGKSELKTRLDWIWILGSDLSFGLSLLDQPKTNPKMSAQLVFRSGLRPNFTAQITVRFSLSLWSRRKTTSIQKVKSPIVLDIKPVAL